MPSSDSTLLLYLAATLLICLSPGPNVMLMISFGLRDGRPGVMRAVAGVVTASLLFLVVSALGVAAALHASSTLFSAIRYAGAAYLVYLGLRLLVAAARAVDVPRAAGAPVTAPPQRARTSAYWQGLVTHLSNPKAILFWSALLPQFLDTGRAVAPQIVFLGLLGIAMDAVVLTGYGLAAAAARHYAPTQAFTRWIDAAAGSFFVLTGALLAFAHRN